MTSNGTSNRASTRIGITGANGFIGAHLLRSVIEKGHRPIAFLQKGTPLQPIADLEGSYDPIYGDLLDQESVDQFISRCDVVFHLAGFNRYWSTDPTLFHKVNIDGVKNIANACLKHKIQKLVHASSCITLGASPKPVLRHEDSGYNLQHLDFLYGETKTTGEMEIKRMVREQGLPAVIVNPTSAIGEKDYGPTPIGKPIGDIARGMWPVYVAGGACFIDVHDCVRGFWLALERGKPGSQYVLVGENLSNQEFMTKVATAAGLSEPRFKVPKALLHVVAHIGQWISNTITKKHPPLTPGMVGLIGNYLYFDGSRAEKELGFKAGPCGPAIERCVQWFRETQWNNRPISLPAPADSSAGISRGD
jgi:dihydroflavonol-4-reductase